MKLLAILFEHFSCRSVINLLEDFLNGRIHSIDNITDANVLYRGVKQKLRSQLVH